MSETRHTPGPWSHRKQSTLGFGEAFAVRREEHDAPFALTLRKADANLIAAAPDLYAALKAVLSNPHGCPMCDAGGVLRKGATEHWDDCVYLLARAALAKAEGK